MSPPSARRCALRVWLPVALAGALFASELVVSAPTVRAAEAEWVVPVPGRVVSAFREPISRYAAGHRGVDLAAAAGAPVKAANDGQVVFAGPVAGALHVVVGHENGIRTSYSFLSSVSVSNGQHLRRGQGVGTAGGSGDAHAPGVLHFGARIGERYIDPMLLFRPPDLTEMVRLVPPPERAAAGRSTPGREKAEIAFVRDADAVEGDDDCAGGIPIIEQVCDGGEAVGGAVEWAGSTAQRSFDAGVEFVEDVGGDVGEWVEARYDELSAVAEALVEGSVEVLEAVGHAIVAVAEALIELGAALVERLFACPQPDSRAARDQPKSNHLAMAVGGRDSSRDQRRDGSAGPSFELHWKQFGYERHDVAYFSYSDSDAYSASDTRGDLHQEARDLGEQIKAQAAANPGVPVDLFGHSQGGVVIALFLQEVYRGHESEYPPIESVVTYASPLQGTPTANLGTSASKSVVDAAAPSLLESQHLDSSALQQLCEGSPTIDGLWQRPVARPIRFLSIAGMEDLWVPSPSTEVPGGRQIVVQAGDPFVPDDHSAIVGDDDAISATQAHLRGEEVGGCGPFAGGVGRGYANLVRAVAIAPVLTPVQTEIELERTADRHEEVR